jgi:hypothetical protein
MLSRDDISKIDAFVASGVVKLQRLDGVSWVSHTRDTLLAHFLTSFVGPGGYLHDSCQKLGTTIGEGTTEEMVDFFKHLFAAIESVTDVFMAQIAASRRRLD